MASRDGIVACLKELESKKDNLGKAISYLAVEWRNLDKDLDTTRSHFDLCVTDLELKQKDLECNKESVIKSSRALEEVRESLDSRLEDIERREETFCRFHRSKVEELELKQKQLDQAQSLIKVKKEEQKKSMEVLLQKFKREKAEYEIIKKSAGEKLKEIHLKERHYKNLCKENSSVQVRMETWAKELALKEEQLKKSKKLSEERGHELLDIIVKECALREEKLNSEKKSLEVKVEKFKMEKQEFEERRKSVDKMLTEISFKEQNCESLYKEANLIQDWTERKIRELYSREEEFASKTEQINGKEKLNEKLKEELDVIQQEYKLIEKKLEIEKEEFLNIQNAEKKQFEILKNSVTEKLKEIDLKERNLEDRSKELKLIQDWIERRVKELDLEEKRFTLREEKLSLQNKSIVVLSENNEKEKEDIADTKRSVAEKLNEISLKENSYEDLSEEVKLKLDDVENRARERDSKEEQIASREIKCELCTEPISVFKKMVHKNISENLVPYTTAEAPRQIIRNNSFAYFLVDMDGSNLFLFLNKQINEHRHLHKAVSAALQMSSDSATNVLEAVHAFYTSYLIKGGSNMEASVVKTCILLLEELMIIKPAIRCQVKKVATYLAVEWSLITVKPTTPGLSLAFLLFVGAYGLASIFDSDELFEIYQTIGEYKLAPTLCCALGLYGEIPGCNYLKCINNLHQSAPEDLQLNNRTNAAFGTDSHRSWNAIPDTIRYAFDPAQFALDAVEACYNSNLRNRKISNEVLNSFHFLLNRLLRVVTLEVKPHTKDQAKKFAAGWKENIQLSDPLEVSCLLLLLATYDVFSSFPMADLLSLLDNVYDVRATSTIFQSLVFSKTKTSVIHDFIRGLVKRGNHLDAIRYVYAFSLVNKISPFPILEEYIENTRKEAQKIRERGQGCSDSLDRGTRLELNSLKEVMDCATLHGHESHHLFRELKAQIAPTGHKDSNIQNTNKKRTHLGGVSFEFEPRKFKRPRRRFSKLQRKPNCSDTSFHPSQ